MKPDSVYALMAQPDVDGALVGGASLEPASFAKIVRSSVALRLAAVAVKRRFSKRP